MPSGRRYFRSLSVGFTALIAMSVAQATEQVDRLKFQLPDGWQRSQQEEVVQYIPPGATPEEVVLQIYPTETLHQSPQHWFKQAVEQRVSATPGLVQELPYQFSGEKLVEIRTLGMVTQESPQGILIHIFAGVTDKDQAQLLHYRTRNANYLREHREMLEQLSRHLEFVDPRPGASSQRLFAGLYP